jgi:hypothetical protein
MRLEHPVSVCHEGLLMKREHPLPPPLQAVSVQPRVVELRRRDVPPTEVTYFDEDGNSVPYPESPLATVMAEPG